MARIHPIRAGSVMKTTTVSVSIDDYNYCAKKGLRLSAILRAVIRSIRSKGEEEPADYAAIADEVKQALGGIDKVGPHNEAEANAFFAWCQAQPEQFQRMDFEARWKAYESSKLPA